MLNKDRRKNYRAADEVLKYFLDKYRDQLQKEENERRKQLKQELINEQRN